MSDVTVGRRFAEFAIEQRGRPLPSDLAHAATRAVVDWFGAAVPGARSAPASILAATLRSEGAGPSRLLASAGRVPTRTAALVNAAASHTIEMDDIYRDGIFHPGSPTVATALAVADRVNAGGPSLLWAVIIGYEIGDRVAKTINPAHYRYWHTTATVGTLSAAAAAATLLDLDVTQTAHALNTAATMAAGLQQAFRSDSMCKPLHAGHAADAGVLAAMLAANGFTAAADVLEGPNGFGAAMSDRPQWEQAFEGLGEDFQIGKTTIKLHACCGHTFAAIDAMAALRAEGLRPQDVAYIEVSTYATALDVAGIADPQTAVEAKFSLAYCVAAELVLGSTRLQAFETAALGDPEIRRLVNATVLRIDPEYDATFPTQRGARVAVVTVNGTKLLSDRPTRKGDPDDPVSDEELTAKFRELVSPWYGTVATAALGRSLWSLADIADVGECPLVEVPDQSSRDPSLAKIGKTSTVE